MRSITPLLLALVLIASACGGTSSSTVATQGDDGEVTSDSPSFEDIEYQSPIADFLGQDIGQFQFDEAAEVERQRDAERQTAECMRERGFEYTPRDVGDMMGFSGPPDEEFEPGSMEWVSKYGFGISTQRFPQSQIGDLVGVPDEQYFGGGPTEENVDPNAEYLAGLTEGEREAYQKALFDPSSFDPEGDPDGDPESFFPEGCQFEAYRSQESNNAGQFYQAFGDELRTMRERIEADSRVVAFNSQVSDCVAEDGLTWTGFEDIYEQFEPRMRQLEPDFSTRQDPFAEAGLDPETMSERELNEFFAEMSRLSPDQLVILAEIQAEEIALAKAVISCGGGPVQYELLVGEVRVEYEQRFLDENAGAIEEFRPQD